MKNMFKKSVLVALTTAFAVVAFATNVQAADTFTVDSSNGLYLTFTTTEVVDLATTGDIKIEYFTKSGSTLTPIPNALMLGAPLVKDKTWDGYLWTPSGNYSKGFSAPGVRNESSSYGDLILSETELSTTVKNNTSYAPTNWVNTPGTYVARVTVNGGIPADFEVTVDPSVAIVSDEAGFNLALANPAVATITVTNSFGINSALVITRPITINGGGNTITANVNGEAYTNNYAVFTITGEAQTFSGVTINNLTVDAASKLFRHGINILNVTDVNLNNVIVKNSTRAGIIVSSSELAVNNITTTNNVWGGINVDKAGSQLTITGVSKHFDGGSGVWADNASLVIITDTASQYSVVTTSPRTDYYLNTTVVKNEAELQAAVANVNLATIKLANNFASNTAVLVNRAVVIDGNDKTLTLNNTANSAGITTGFGVGANATIKNLTITTDSYALNDNLVEIQGTGTVATFENVTVKESKKAGIIVLDGSKLVLKGTLKLLENSWGGIEVRDGANTSVSFAGVSSLEFTPKTSTTTPAVWVDKNVTPLTAGTYVTGAAAVLATPVAHEVAATDTVPAYNQVWWTVSTPNPTTIIITNSAAPVVVTVADNGAGSTLDLRAIEDHSSATTTAQITVNSGSAGGDVSVVIPAGTVIAGNGWNGIINLPTITTTNAEPVLGSREFITLGLVINVGSDVPLTFTNPVKLVLPGQAGKKVGFTHGSDTLTEITTPCVDNELPNDANECKMNVGPDMVVWTKHFTTFATYDVTTRRSSGGGGRVTVANPSPVVATTPAVNTPAGQVLGEATYTFTAFMKVGARNNDVKELQAKLNAGNFGVLAVDGVFGPKTKAAVMAFQRANLLTADGIVGPMTRGALNK